MSAARIAVIGAGMAGLSCARALTDAGLQPVIFDKGRGIGGRLATRRTAEGLQFDHGAQYLTAQGAGFAAVVQEMLTAGDAAPWPDGSGRNLVVGLPGMSGIAKHLGRGLDVRQNAELVSITRDQKAWLLQFDAGDLRFDHVVLTPPAPQILRLLGDDHAFAPPLSAVEMAPCLTLMAAFSPTLQGPFQTRRDKDHPLAWIALDSSKPGRVVPGGWVAQASPDWSRSHLSLDMAEVTARLLPMLCTALDFDIAQATHSASHRWRYAAVTVALGAAFLRDTTGTLYAGGDWCIGARAESAWISGNAIAQDLLRRV